MAEVDELGEHRPELHDGGEPGARIVPPEEGGDDAQVRRAGDRQELGEPLHDPEDDRLQHVHGCGSVEAGRCSLASRDAPSWSARDGLRTARRGRRAFATLDARAARAPALRVAHDGPGRAGHGDRLDARPRGHRAPAAVLRPDRRDRHPRRDARAAHAARGGGRGGRDGRHRRRRPARAAHRLRDLAAARHRHARDDGGDPPRVGDAARHAGRRLGGARRDAVAARSHRHLVLALPRRRRRRRDRADRQPARPADRRRPAHPRGGGAGRWPSSRRRSTTSRPPSSSARRPGRRRRCCAPARSTTTSGGSARRSTWGRRAG